MAHSRSALKRWRQSLERRDRNRTVKSRTRTLLTRAVSLSGSDESTAEAAVKAAISALDRAAQKGVIHKNAASRSKSRLLKRFNLAQAQAVAAAAGSVPAAEEKKPAARKPAAAKPATAKKPAASAKKPAAKPAADKAPRGRTPKAT